MAAEDLTKTLTHEVLSTQQETSEIDQIRQTVSDVYTFVRSREINKTIAGFTFDHYIDERMRGIKGERVIRSASNPGDGVGTRPCQLDAIAKLESDFTNSFDKMKKLASKSAT